jgi:hypothetical protein
VALRRLAPPILLGAAFACGGANRRDAEPHLPDSLETANTQVRLAAVCRDPSVVEYLRISAKLPAARRPPLRSLAAVDAEIEALDDRAPDDAPPLAAPELGQAIERALGIETLRADLASRRVDVARLREPGDDPREHRLLFRDPWVGSFEGLLLVPAGEGPFPAVLALHGHGDSAALYRDLHHARDYAARGIAILMLRFRAMEIDACEHELSRELLAQGTTLMGMRAYEALVALRHLSQRSDVDASRLALIGHSGGSSTGNLVIRLAPELRAYVSDHGVDYRHVVWYEPWHCESVPALAPLARQVNDFSSARLPVWRVPYGFGRQEWFERDVREAAQLVDYFAEHLGASERRSGGSE